MGPMGKPRLLNAPARDDADVPIEEVEPPESSA